MITALEDCWLCFCLRLLEPRLISHVLAEKPSPADPPDAHAERGSSSVRHFRGSRRRRTRPVNTATRSSLPAFRVGPQLLSGGERSRRCRRGARASLSPPAGATQDLSPPGVLGIKLPRASRPRLPVPSGHGSASWAAGGGREPAEGSTGVLWREGNPLPALYGEAAFHYASGRSEAGCTRGGGPGEGGGGRLPRPHPPRQDLLGHLPAGHHMDAGDTGKRVPF